MPEPRRPYLNIVEGENRQRRQSRFGFAVEKIENGGINRRETKPVQNIHQTMAFTRQGRESAAHTAPRSKANEPREYTQRVRGTEGQPGSRLCALRGRHTSSRQAPGLGLASLVTLLRPGEVEHWDDEEGVAAAGLWLAHKPSKPDKRKYRTERWKTRRKGGG